MILSVPWRATTLPSQPKGQKRPADVIGNAVRVTRIATGEEADDVIDDGKDPAAKALGARREIARDIGDVFGGCQLRPRTSSNAFQQASSPGPPSSTMCSISQLSRLRPHAQTSTSMRSFWMSAPAVRNRPPAGTLPACHCSRRSWRRKIATRTVRTVTSPLDKLGLFKPGEISPDG